ncbi:MAG: hypothetical protein NTV72_00505 [Candidatus Taylorbacteria bacterium]|nr:hypothetical protein [Candidatus Taylorbacteria bacterium]
MKNKAAQMLGRKGGSTTVRKYGKKHFSRMGRLSGKKRRNKAIKQAVF